MKREASYSDVFQVRPAVGPGGYMREDLYATNVDHKFKMQAQKKGDARPTWRVAW